MTFDFEFKCFLALRKNKQTVNKLFTVCSLLFFSRGFTDPPGSVLCVSVYISHSSRLLMAALKDDVGAEAVSELPPPCAPNHRRIRSDYRTLIGH